MTWLTGWTYQNAHTIKGSSAGAQTDYPVGIKVYYGSGVDGTETVGGATFGKVYCDSKCKTDFGDIRFTKSDKVSLLDYWIEEQVDSDYAIIWVEVDSIPGSPGTVDIYIYYGNAGAATTSNGDDTFIVWNDCDDALEWDVDYTLGSPIWGERTVDGFSTIMLETNAHNEKLRLAYNGGTNGGRKNRRYLSRIKHTDWNTDGYFQYQTGYRDGPPIGYDLLYYGTYYDTIRLYAYYDGVSDYGAKSWPHPDGWKRYQVTVNNDGDVDGYSDSTALVGTTVDGDYADGIVKFYVGQFGSGINRYYVDWFAAGKYVDPEPTHISWGGETAEGEEDLAAGFWVCGGIADLPAGFRLRQDVADLVCRLQVMTHLDLPAKFDAIRSDSLALPASFRTGGRGNVPARFRVTKYYDLEGTGGIAFYWWGAANPVEAMNQLILESPTGFWYTDFYDGLAAWRLVEIPWGSFTWVSAPQRRLEPHRYWPYPPDQTTIGAFVWTVHTHGLRRLDYVYAYPRVLPAQLSGRFDIRRTATVELAAGFMIRQAESLEVPAKFYIPPYSDLPAGFTVRQDFKELSAKFEVAVEVIEVYQVVGTGTDTVPLVFAVMEGMTQTITGMLTGDKVVIHFDCTLTSKTGSSFPEVHFKTEVGGVAIGPENDVQFAADSSDALKDRNVAQTRYYLIPSNGDYTFTVSWVQDGAVAVHECLAGRRTMVIIHIR